MSDYQFQGTWNIGAKAGGATPTLYLTGLPDNSTFTVRDVVMTMDPTTGICPLLIQMPVDSSNDQISLVLGPTQPIFLTGLSNGFQMTTDSSGRVAISQQTLLNNLEPVNSAFNIYYYVAGTA